MHQSSRRNLLSVSTVARQTLDSPTIERMWQLYRAFYEHVDRETFLADLGEKTEVFLARDRDTGDIVGFSTAKLYRHRHRGTWVGVYFSGDTIISPQYWGQTAFHNCVASRLLRWKLRNPFTPLYWFLICSGYRTYLMMTRNIPDHYPHFSRGCPEWERGLIDDLSESRFGPSWYPALGVIRTPGAQVVLRSAVAPLSRSMAALPEIQYFRRINPGCVQGDELAVIGHMNLRAFVNLATKSIRKTFRRWGGELETQPQRTLSAPNIRVGDELP